MSRDPSVKMGPPTTPWEQLNPMSDCAEVCLAAMDFQLDYHVQKQAHVGSQDPLM